jgi:hypothetical protein
MWLKNEGYVGTKLQKRPSQDFFNTSRVNLSYKQMFQEICWRTFYQKILHLGTDNKAIV